MLAQYTAASLTSEAKLLASPGSADTVPTVQHQEDHVPMGPSAARSALEVVDRVADVVAIELLCAAQALDFRIHGEAEADNGAIQSTPPLRPAAATQAVHARVRELVSRLTDDRVLYHDLKALGSAVRAGRFSEPSADDSGPAGM